MDAHVSNENQHYDDQGTNTPEWVCVQNIY